MSYDIEYDKPRVEEDEITRDNIDAIRRAMEKIEEILNDIDERLKQGGL
jgi:hypothetical protein